MPPTEALPMNGIYTLIIFLSKEVCLNVGRLGTQRFPKGYYTYTGSSLGKGALSLSHRISRHLRKEKRKRWHIDYLLADENVNVRAVITLLTNQRLECKINHLLRERFGAEVIIDGFGASDCKSGCKSHLLYFGEENVKQKIAMLYEKKLGSKSITIDFC